MNLGCLLTFDHDTAIARSENLYDISMLAPLQKVAASAYKCKASKVVVKPPGDLCQSPGPYSHE